MHTYGANLSHILPFKIEKIHNFYSTIFFVESITLRNS
jgi:hypothetical protein